MSEWQWCPWNGTSGGWARETKTGLILGVFGLKKHHVFQYHWTNLWNHTPKGQTVDWKKMLHGSRPGVENKRQSTCFIIIIIIIINIIKKPFTSTKTIYIRPSNLGVWWICFLVPVYSSHCVLPGYDINRWHVTARAETPAWSLKAKDVPTRRYFLS